MKKGCFFTTVVILTILIGAGIYIYRNHKDLLIVWLKPTIVNKVQKETEKELGKIQPSVYKDSLKSLINDYANFIRENKNYKLDRGQDFIEEVQYVIHRKKIDSTDIRQLTEFLNKEKLTYERSEKNGN